MGLIKGLALLPLTPVMGVMWVAQQIQQEVDRQMLDPEVILDQLRELQRAVDAGEISETEYLGAEEVLLDRLEVLQADPEI